MNKQLLYQAIVSGDLKEVDSILKVAPDLLNEKVVGKTWLHLAASKNRLDVAKLLVAKGIPFNVDWFGCEPPLNTATDCGAFDIAKWLVESGAELDGSDNFLPPIVGAIQSGNTELVELFLNNGANIDFMWGEFRYTPVSFARSFGDSHQPVLKLLLDAGAADDKRVTDVERKPNNIDLHLSKYYGRVRKICIGEMISNIPFSISVVDCDGEEPCTILVTNGMSSRPLNTPPGAEDYARVELMIYLPKKWPINHSSLSDPLYSWPIDWLRILANFPHENNTWVEPGGAVYANGEPPEKLAPNTELSCLLALATPGEEGTLIDDQGNLVQIYSVYPLYAEEWNLQKTSGTAALLEKFQERDVSAIVDVSRSNVCTIGK